MEMILSLLCSCIVPLAGYGAFGYGMMKVFQKAGLDQPIMGFVPIYNVYLFVIEIAKKDIVWVLLSLFVPFAFILPCMDAAEKFGKERTYGIGMGLLPFIFFPLLGMSDAQYQGGRGGSRDRAMSLDDDEDDAPPPPRKKKPRPIDDDDE